MPVSDTRGTCAWADFHDNFLVIIMNVIPPGQSGFIDPMVPGVNETAFVIGSGDAQSIITVKKASNKLVIVDEKRRILSINLPKGQAKRFYWEVSSKNRDDILTHIGQYLALEDQRKVKAFVESKSLFQKP